MYTMKHAYCIIASSDNMKPFDYIKGVTLYILIFDVRGDFKVLDFGMASPFGWTD
jgi:hypothetical protein